APLGDVTIRKMFGGHGVFADGDMFALVDSAGNPFLRADEMTSGPFEAAGSARHGGMPYWSIPPAVLDNDDDLVAWARIALGVARAAKKGKHRKRG
ncbi:MAG: TfoX/Sxy family protein, partial [Acidimicrobiia bacterium]|nr:TfoX/Sxy family protein [Acidimicrobiia bacterium]